MLRDWERQKNWNILSEADQKAQASPHLKLCCKILGLQEDVELLDIKDKDRFVLSYVQDPSKPDFAKNMIKLERLMRQTIGIAVDLRLEPLKDKNKRFDRNYLRGVEKLDVE